MAGLDISLIAHLPLFRGMTPDDLNRVVRVARSAHYPKESVVFEQDQESHSLFLLLDGHIRVVQTNPDGHQIIARYINPGELFGIAVALNRTTYPATAVAAVDCVVIAWPNSFWTEFAAHLPAFREGTYQTVAARLQETQSRVMQMSTEQVEQRIAHTLLRLAGQAGRKVAEGIEIDFPLSRQNIAEMADTTLHTVSRLLSGWEERGVVRSGRQKVVITDPHGLLLIAEGRRKI